MTASAHALIGAAIITKIPDLRISLPLILLSHVLGDLPQHWDTGENWQEKGMRKVFFDATVDLVIGYLLVTVIFIWWLQGDPIKIYLGTSVSLLFDYLEFPYFFLHWKFVPWSWINNFNHLFHKKLLDINLTLTNQIVFASLFVLLAATK